MSKFKEFWISQMNLSQNEDFICEDIELTKHFPDCVFEHVIEYAALAAKDSEIEKLKKQLEICREAINNIARSPFLSSRVCTSDDLVDLARQALAELEKMK